MAGLLLITSNPPQLASSGEKEFRIEVESLWADLNEIVYATQVEKIKFVKVRDEWLADGIDFIKTVPRPRVLPFNVASEKRGKEALSVAKIFMKGLINRNAKLVTQRLTQDFQSRFSSSEEMEKYLFGPSEPHFVAYEPNTLTQREPGEMEVKVRIFQVTQGKRGSGSQEAKLTVKEGRTDWNISEFEFLQPKAIKMKKPPTAGGFDPTHHRSEKRLNSHDSLISFSSLCPLRTLSRSWHPASRSYSWPSPQKDRWVEAEGISGKLQPCRGRELFFLLA